MENQKNTHTSAKQSGKKSRAEIERIGIVSVAIHSCKLHRVTGAALNAKKLSKINLQWHNAPSILSNAKPKPE